MGVYIKGMEMPKSCAFCPMFDDVYTHLSDDDEYVCKLGVNLNYYQYAGYEPKDCPLVFVPPHGQLIDADALDYTMLYKENWMRGTGVEAPAVWKSDIDSAPTIIPAEVDMENQMKVGEWIPLGHRSGYLKHPWSEDFKCPFCGYEQYTLMMDPPNRCPKCWASLKLKKENETEVEK